jgi:hypothetical protein
MNLSGLGQLFEGITSGMNQQLAQKHNEELERKYAYINFLNQVLQSPGVSDDVKNQMWPQLKKLLDPETQKAYSQALPIMQNLGKLAHGIGVATGLARRRGPAAPPAPGEFAPAPQAAPAPPPAPAPSAPAFQIVPNASATAQNFLIPGAIGETLQQSAKNSFANPPPGVVQARAEAAQAQAQAQARPRPPNASPYPGAESLRREQLGREDEDFERQLQQTERLRQQRIEDIDKIPGLDAEEKARLKAEVMAGFTLPAEKVPATQKTSGIERPGFTGSWDRTITTDKYGNQTVTWDKQVKGPSTVEQRFEENVREYLKVHPDATQEEAESAVAGLGMRKIEADTQKAEAAAAKSPLGKLGDAYRIARNPQASAEDKAAANVVIEKDRAELQKINAQVAKTRGALQSASDSALSSQAAEDPGLDLQAWDYLVEGRFDVRGLGAKASQDAENIVKRSRQIMKDFGLTSGDIFALRAEKKGLTSSFARSSSQFASIDQFEKTMLANAQLAKELSAAYRRGDVQFINRLKQAFDSGTGDPDALNFAAQLHGLASEWAKIMAGSTSAAGVPVSAAKDVEGLISSGISSGQLESLIDNVMIPDARNRRNAFKSTQGDLLNQLRGLTAKPSTPPAGGASDADVQKLIDKYKLK